MAISLTNSQGDLVSLYGTTTGRGEPTTTPSPITDTGRLGNAAGTAKLSATRPGSTKSLGYTDLAAESPGASHAAPLTAVAPQPQKRQLNADEPVEIPQLNAPELLRAATEHFGPQEDAGRNAEFGIGATSSLPGAAEGIGAVAEDAAPLLLG